VKQRKVVKQRQRTPKAPPPSVEDRAYFTRAEVCRRFGFSPVFLQAAILQDSTLPVLQNGKIQHFPKEAFGAWYEDAGRRRLQVSRAILENNGDRKGEGKQPQPKAKRRREPEEGE